MSGRLSRREAAVGTKGPSASGEKGALGMSCNGTELDLVKPQRAKIIALLHYTLQELVLISPTSAHLLEMAILNLTQEEEGVAE